MNYLGVRSPAVAWGKSDESNGSVCGRCGNACSAHVLSTDAAVVRSRARCCRSSCASSALVASGPATRSARNRAWVAEVAKRCRHWSNRACRAWRLRSHHPMAISPSREARAQIPARRPLAIARLLAGEVGAGHIHQRLAHGVAGRHGAVADAVDGGLADADCGSDDLLGHAGALEAVDGF